MSETESKIFEVEEQLDDATKCSICTETFKEPKMLSCVHTFCKICLQTYAESLNKLAKDEVPCPICRQKFQIPESGLDELPNNVFVEKLIDIKSNLPVSLSTSQNLCESCSGEDSSCSSDEVPKAEVFCTDCQLKLCKRCHQHHLKGKIFKNHKLFKISDRLEIGIGDIKAAASWFCPRHSTKISDVYCSTCKDTMCYICFLESHTSHGGLSVESASLDFQKAIENNINCQLQNVPHLKQKLEKLNENKSVLIQTFEDLEVEINKRREELKAMVDSQSDSLLSELKTKQEAALKKMIIHEDTIETLMISVDSYKTYFQQLTAFGSSISICKALEYLSRRVDELQKQCDLEVQNTLQPPNLRFKAGTSREFLKSFIVRIIGELEGPIKYSIAPKSVTEFKLSIAPNSVPEPTLSKSSNSLLKPQNAPISVTEFNPNSDSGDVPINMAILENELFVFVNLVVDIYNLGTLKFKRKWSNCRLGKLGKVKDVKSCERNKRLFVMNETGIQNQNEIMRFDPGGMQLNTWSVGEAVGQLSITPESNILFTASKQSQLQEYTPNGQLVRIIQLTPNYDFHNSWHAIQLNSGLFLVSNSSSGVGKICLIDSNGRIFHVIEKVGKAVQLLCPVYMEQDKHGNIIVADYGLGRLFVLSSSLQEINANFYPSRDSFTPFKPLKIIIDESNSRIFATESQQSQNRCRINVLNLNVNTN